MKATAFGAPSCTARCHISRQASPSELRNITAAPASQTVAVSSSVSREPRHLLCTQVPINLFMNTGSAPMMAIPSAAMLSMSAVHIIPVGEPYTLAPQHRSAANASSPATQIRTCRMGPAAARGTSNASNASGSGPWCLTARQSSSRCRDSRSSLNLWGGRRGGRPAEAGACASCGLPHGSAQKVGWSASSTPQCGTGSSHAFTRM
mmetsp:Transcript_8802/g.23424  ORF Transcript_8802/g.23424 Transcript_8802/m.23424 type:complete len:206 (-) Transcript_8802:139-756(-)